MPLTGWGLIAIAAGLSGIGPLLPAQAAPAAPAARPAAGVSGKTAPKAGAAAGTAAGTATGTATGTVGAPRQATSATQLPSPLADPKKWPAPQFLDDEAEESCNIVFNLAPPLLGGRFILVFDWQDSANYYSFECTGRNAAFMVTQKGERRVLAYGQVQLGTGTTVTIQRRPWLMRAVINGQAQLTAYDASFNEGKIGVIPSAWRWSNAKVQPAEAIRFDDDFTRAGTEGDADWKRASGKWRLSASSERISARNATMSSNPFAFEVDAGAGRSLAHTGRWFWDNYDARVAVRPMGPGTVGVAAYVQDASNYLAFLWSSQEGPQARRLVRVRGGAVTVLASAPGAYLPRQWYNLGLRTSPGYVEALLDGGPSLRVRDNTFGQGGIGLLAENCSAAFDDVQVRSYDFFRQDFGAGGSSWDPARDGAWTPRSGVWGGRDGNLISRPSPGQDQKERWLLAGRKEWDGYQVFVSASAGANSAAGVVTGYHDEGSYTLFRWAPSGANVSFKGRQQLVRASGGKLQVLADEPLSGPFTSGKPVRLNVRCESGAVSVYAGNDLVAQSNDDASVPGGQVALWAQGNGVTQFSDLAILFPPPAERPKVAARMEGDVQMMGWASAVGEWPGRVGTRGKEFWNTGEFFGDSSLSFPWRASYDSLEVALRAQRNKFESGYVLRGETVTGGQSIRWTLKREGRELKSATVPLSAIPGAGSDEGGTVNVMLRGNGVLVVAGGRTLLGVLEKDSPRGSCLAVRAERVLVRPEKLVATSANRDDYTFTTAPTDFYSPQGDWSVFSRWPCYGDWSFFGGAGLNPVLWTKRTYGGDVVVDMYAHNQMDLPKEVGYSRPGDFNISLAADGKNPSSGYSFILAGWDNTRTALLRGNVTVAQNTGPEARFERTINHNFRWHRRWAYVRAEARHTQEGGKPGVRLKLSVDDKVLIDYFDPEPLPLLARGGRVAFWTPDGTLMIARARIESESPGGRALPAGLLDAEGQPPADKAPGRSTGGFVPVPLKVEGETSALVETAAPAGTWRVQNPRAGGAFAVTLTRGAVTVQPESKMALDLKLPPEARLDLYVTIDGVRHLVEVCGKEQPDAAAPPLGAATLTPRENGWQNVSFDLGAALSRLPGKAKNWKVESVVLGALHGDVYRYLGFGGNPLGTAYQMRNWELASG